MPLLHKLHTFYHIPRKNRNLESIRVEWKIRSRDVTGWQAYVVVSPQSYRIDPNLSFHAQHYLTLTRDVTYPIILGGFRNIRSIRRATSLPPLNHIKPSNSRDRAFLDNISVEVAWSPDKFLFPDLSIDFETRIYIYIYTRRILSDSARSSRYPLETAGNDIISTLLERVKLETRH